MATHSWKRRHTKHLGEVWFPYADVHLQARDGRLRRFAFLIDSGAVISLLRRSAAQTLGIELEGGKKIGLSGVGGGKASAYVHNVTTQFDPEIQIPVPYAIAEIEAVPNLLGRIGIFDQLQIDFDASLRETRVSAPWLDDDQRDIWNFLIQTERHIRARWDDVSLSPVVDKAARRFLERGAQLVAAAAGLAKLHRTYAGPPFVRALFEVSAQFEYVMQDPESRAQDFLDFEHITKYKNLQSLIRNPAGPIADAVANDPRRTSMEPALKAEHDRVRPRFKRDNGRLSTNWYKKTVLELMKAVGMDAEYDLYYRAASNWIHADPFSFVAEPLANRQTVLMLCLHYYCRLLLRIADTKQIILTSEQHKVLRQLRDGFSK